MFLRFHVMGQGPQYLPLTSPAVAMHDQAVYRTTISVQEFISSASRSSRSLSCIQSLFPGSSA